jgi:ribosome maturation factor RimP
MNEIFETFDLNLNARNLIISVSIVNQRLGKMTTLDDKTEVSEAMEKKIEDAKK